MMIFLGIVILAVGAKVHFHASQKCPDLLVIDIVFVHNPLETMQDRIGAEFVGDRFKGIIFETAHLFLFILIVKSVNDLIGKPDIAIYGVNGPPQGLSEQPYPK
jgi:hypothetical protein